MLLIIYIYPVFVREQKVAQSHIRYFCSLGSKSGLTTLCSGVSVAVIDLLHDALTYFTGWAFGHHSPNIIINAELLNHK